MTCSRLDEVLTDAATPEALAHAKTCPTCGPARAAWDAMHPVGAPVKPTLADAARAELKARPTARRWWWDVVVLLGIDVAVAAIAFAMVGLTQASNADRGVAAALVALMGLGTWAAIAPKAHLVRYAVVALAAIAAGWTVMAGSGVPGPGGAGCALVETGLTAVPLAVVLLITSRFAWDFWRALAGGLSVGATGLFVLHLHCGNGAAEHLAAFHVAPWLLMASAAVLLRRSLPTRSYAR